MPEERKLVTVLFADIVGSTSLAGAHDAEVVQSAMDAAFERIAPVIRAHGGSVEKFIGDAVMSVFGVPAAHDDDAQRAVRAAFAIRDAVAAAGGRLPLEIRVGVNTGEAVARTDGADQRMVTGIAVNFAQRLQAAAQPGEILVGGVTQGLTKGAVRYGAPRTVQAKGIGEVTAFVAEALLDEQPEQHRGLEGLRAPLIGRDRELHMLNEVNARTRETREPHLVTVYAPAGAGKSRLAAEFTKGVGTESVRSGRCLPYGEGITYYALQQILREDAGIEPQDTRENAVAKLLAAAAAAMDADERDPVFERLRVLAGLASVDEALAGVPRDQLNEELRWGLRRYLERRAAASPLVIVFEDIHWAEPTLLDLIESLAESVRGPVCIIALARPDLKDVRPTWGSSAANATTIALPPLSSDDTRHLVAELLAIDALSEEVRTEVITRSEGNPLYVEEFLRMLMDTGGIAQRDGRWIATAAAATVDVPPTLVGLISARLDRVSPEVKRVLQRGSLAGRIFSVATLTALGDGEVPDPQVLREAVRRDMLVEADERALGDGRVYRFKHVLIRDVAYATLPKVERSKLHDRYGRWLEDSLGERSAEVLEIVAYHSEQAHAFARELGVPDADALGRRAFDLLYRSAQAARHRDDNAAAESLFERAAAIGAAAPAPMAAVLEARGWTAIYRHWREESAAHATQLERLADEARAAGPSPILAQLILQLAWVIGTKSGRMDEVAVLNAEALDVARTSNDPTTIAASLTQRGIFRHWSGDLSGSTVAMTEALAILDAHGIERDRPHCLVFLRRSATERGDFSEAVRHHEAGVQSREDRRSQVARVNANVDVAKFAAVLGDYELAIRLLHETTAVARELKGAHGASVGWALGQTLVASGDPRSAIAPLDVAIEHFEKWQQYGWLPMVQTLGAIARARSGDAPAGRTLVEGARAVALAYDWAALMWVERADAGVSEAEGNAARAEAAFGKALALIPEAFQLDRADARLELGRFLLRQRRPADARPVLKSVRDFFHDPVAYRRRAEVERLLSECDAVRA